MKSILKKVAGLALAAALVIGMFGCSNDTDTHEHTFATTYTSDETHHWHAATCEHTEQVKDKVEHSFGEWDNGKRKCSTCNYEQACEHTFGEWTITVQPTEEAEGTKERECSVCGYKATEAIAKLDHVHTFAAEWTSDATHHWHAATCEHTTEVKDKAAHTFGEWTSNDDATVTEDGTKWRICSACQYKEIVADEGSKITSKVTRLDDNFVKISGVPIKGTETWWPTATTFVSGRQLTIPTLIVCDHEVTRGEFKEVMKIDPSAAKAYDKNGNQLTGDAVLNNPVNYVNWYDAIAYCNKKSIAENLTPCYSVEGITDWANLAYSSIPNTDNTAWNEATCNFDADGYRLPTEAEWEWLVRGGEKYTYAGSHSVKEVAWYGSNTNWTGTREVKTKKENGYGLYDMSGNVEEWCWDWDGDFSSTRVLRGGSWYDLDISCQIANRNNYYPHSRYNLYGFRVVRTAN